MSMLLLLMGLLLGGVAHAQDPPPAETIAAMAELEAELGPAGTPPAPDQLDDEERRISRGLRCPVCQGGSIVDSPADSAVNMRKRVRELVALGFDQDQIHEYYLARYGDWILLAPPATGLNWIVWVCPALGGGVALAVLGAVVARWRREEDPVPLPSETGEAPLDDYERKLLEEIEG